MTRLRALLAERILVLDGATGTYLQGRDLGPADFGGEAYEGCNEHLVLTRPDVVRDMHEGYLAAGADIVETNTFGGTRIPLAEYGLADKVREINATAARLAREACAKFETPDRPRFVAGSMGPGTKTISVTGGITFDEVAAAFAEQTVGLVEGGADVLFLETQQDTLNVKAALLGIDRGFADAGRVLPIVLSVSIESMGTMLAGQSIEAAYVSVAHRDLLAMGMNCATGPDFMTDHLRTLAQISRFPVSCFPNAGLPDEEGRYNETPELFVRKVERFLAEGWVNIIGGCCGTTAEHVRALVELASRYRPRTAAPVRRTVVSGIEVLPIEDDRRPVIVGERTNVIGSRKFKELVVGGDLDQAAEIGRRQVRGGAQVLDVCLANPDRDELADMTAFLDVLTRKVKVPLMLDSTDHRVLEQSLERCQGKAIINSINLEDGEERFEKVVPLIHRYGAAVVVGCIDEDKARGMAVTRERKLQIAERSYRLLTEKYGVAEEDIIFDALVFPVGTGDQNYVGAGAETVEGVRLIKDALPRTKTVLGVSNVSFGLPSAGREILNSVFLYHCVRAGLDLAIVNAEKLERYPSIPEEERRLAEDLIFWRGDDPVAAFAAHFRGKSATPKRSDRSTLPLDERLARYIIEGSKDGLIDDLDLKLREAKPLQIINGPLMAGMDEVGRLFNNNELIVAEVLQSAEAMKAAVAHLEPFMEKSESANKGTVVLATVKGDVHDIGKNLVEIILGNNGFRVVNLGIKVPPEDLIKAYREHRPDLIGLSGLLVKSAQQMVVTAEDLKAAGVRCPVLVGGAALSARFTASKIAPAYGELVCYANDAMTGLDLANKLADERTREATAAQVQAEQERLRGAPAPGRGVATANAVATSIIRHDRPIPTPPDLKRHVIERLPLEDIFPYVNPAMLYGKHLGLRGNLEALLERGDEKAKQLRQRVTAVENEILAAGAMPARAVYKFFPVYAEGDAIVVLGPDRRVIETFTFPRQSA